MRIVQADVLVVGGGTAGVTAASAAANNGASVVLAEIGCGLGGIGTHGGIHSYYMGVPVKWKEEVDRETVAVASHILQSKAVGFHPDAKKLVIANRLALEGVALIYNAIAVDVIKDGNRVDGVILETPEETIAVHAAVTIDSTSNGDVAALAGAEFTSGREWDGALHCYSLPPRFFDQGEKRLLFRNFDAGWVDVASAKDVSRAYADGRSLLKTLPDMEKHEPISTSSLLGAREGRLVLGEYVLEMEDLIFDRTFPDAVMRCYSHYDNHARDFALESTFAQIWVSLMGLWPQKLGCDVPYRCFVPKAVDGLLVGCRALSMTHDASTALRMQPDMHAAGEVAGTAAALAVQRGVPPRELDVSLLQTRLVERGTLSREDIGRAPQPWVTVNGDKREDGIWTTESVKSPDRIHTLLSLLGTEQEGKALWWLWQTGTLAVPALREALERTDGQQQIGAAIALVLLGEADGATHLIRCVAEQDETMMCRSSRLSPRWVQALIALTSLRHPGAAEWLRDRLVTRMPADEPKLPGYVRLQYVLKYLIAVADQVPPTTANVLVSKVGELLSDPELGNDWYNKYGTVRSNRWSTELTAAFLLGLWGRPEAEDIIERYADDRRSYVREAARRMKTRLQNVRETKGVRAR